MTSMPPGEARSNPAEAVPWIDVSELLARPEARVIDLRAPAEFVEDHLPDACNVPLFDDAQRALVGTLYKRQSPDAAFEAGREIVLERVHGLVDEIARAAGWEVPADELVARVERMTQGGIASLEERLEGEPADGLPEHPVVLHCWRGGLRSRSVVALLRGLGLADAVVLRGGYRAYRERVREGLAAWQSPPAFALRGLTGVGKTLVLRALEELRPGWTVDLEGCAGHRSSLLGMVGLEPVSQKAFDSRLHDRIRAGFPGPVVFEGESRRVGDVTIPPRLWEALQNATNLELTAPTERRVEVLMEDYLADESARPKLREQLAAVEARMKRPAPLVELFDAGREAELTEVLLEHYYDPLYRHSESGREYAAHFDTSDPRACAAAIAEWIEGRLATSCTS